MLCVSVSGHRIMKTLMKLQPNYTKLAQCENIKQILNVWQPEYKIGQRRLSLGVISVDFMQKFVLRLNYSDPLSWSLLLVQLAYKKANYGSFDTLPPKQDQHSYPVHDLPKEIYSHPNPLPHVPFKTQPLKNFLRQRCKHVVTRDCATIVMRNLGQAIDARHSRYYFLEVLGEEREIDGPTVTIEEEEDPTTTPKISLHTLVGVSSP